MRKPKREYQKKKTQNTNQKHHTTGTSYQLHEEDLLGQGLGLGTQELLVVLPIDVDIQLGEGGVPDGEGSFRNLGVQLGHLGQLILLCLVRNALLDELLLSLELRCGGGDSGAVVLNGLVEAGDESRELLVQSIVGLLAGQFLCVVGPADGTGLIQGGQSSSEVGRGQSGVTVVLDANGLGL